MKHVGHFIAGSIVGNVEQTSPIFDPATGLQTAHVTIANAAEIDSAVAAAKEAQPAWAATGLQFRADMMLKLRDAIKRGHADLTGILMAELGKTRSDAAAEVDRSIEVLGQAASVGSWYGSTISPGVSRGVDVQEIRYPIGVVAAISPFNFPVMIPILQSAMSIVCGNTVVMKPSDRNPSASLRIAQLFQEAGLPDGVFNVLMGDRKSVDRLLEHPDVAGISFVGSTPVAKYVRTKGVANNKRVQAFGGGKNHMVVLPDADLDMAADAAVSAAFGAAGQRCMAVSVVVAVGSVGDALVEKIAARLPGLKVGSPTLPASQLGPVITADSRARILSYLDKAEGEGARMVVDGRLYQAENTGWYVGPSLVDHVRPGTSLHQDEIFGPVLSVVRVQSYDEAAAVLAGHPLGNGAAIFTRDGGAAKRFIDETEAGQVGVNIPIPFPVFFHSFGGWKDSSFTETKLFGPGALNFCTRSKTVSIRWPDPSSSAIDLGFPSSR